GKVDGGKLITVTLMLRPRMEIPSGADTEADGITLPGQRQYRSRAQVAAEHGATAADIDKVQEFANEHGLTVSRTIVSSGVVKLSGTIDQLSRAFEVKLKKYRAKGQT